MTLPIRPLHPEIARCQPWRGRGRWFGRGSGRVGGAQRRLRGRGAGAVHRGQRGGVHQQPQRAAAGTMENIRKWVRFMMIHGKALNSIEKNHVGWISD